MKIDLKAVATEQFMVHQHMVNGETLHLVQPQHIGVSWTQENKIYRSSVWNDDGELVSAGFPKFPNLGETPATFPVPTNLLNSTITAKLDGSLLIVSKYKGQYILRTRGTVDATKLDNGYELNKFKQEFIPRLDDLCDGVQTWNGSFLFEWLTASPDQQIILKYDNVPAWIFIGIVNHTNYALSSQSLLDKIANLYGFKRPEQHTFNSVDELVSMVSGWKNKEGVVLYTNAGQSLHKVKSDDYKKRHAFKSDASLKNTLELFFQFGKPELGVFEQKIQELYDYECLQMVTLHILRICEAWREVQEILDEFDDFVEEIKLLNTRKEQAQRILTKYASVERASMVFNRLDGKALDDTQLKKIFWQLLDKN